MKFYIADDADMKGYSMVGKDLAVDVETASDGSLLTVQFAWSPMDGASINARTVSPHLIVDLLRRNNLMFHFGYYDIQQLEPLVYGLVDTFDTFCAAKLLYYEKFEGFGLKFLAKELLGMEMKNITDIAGKDVKMENVDIGTLVDYGIDDVLATYRLATYFKSIPWIASHMRLVIIESELQGVCARMKTRGILFDKSITEEFHQQLAQGMADIKQEFPSVSLNSNGSVSNHLFNVLKLDTTGVKVLKNKSFSVARYYLEMLKDKHPDVAKIMEWKSLAKLASTYTKSYASTVGKDGAVHSRFDSFGSCTGRFSSSSPNLQNVPVSGKGRILRKAFRARDGYMLVAFDYKQIELIVLACMANETKMLEVIEKGGDLHSLTASLIYNIPQEQVTKEQRGAAKAINFGMIYGGGPGLFLPYTNDSWDEAHRMYNSFFGSYPALSAYFDVMGRAVFKGYTETYWGRRRKIPKFDKNASGGRNAALFRLAKNSPIQGTAADILKLAMCLCDTAIWRSYILMTIHDEIIFEVPKEYLDEEIHTIQNLMEGVFQHMKVDIEVGEDWFDMKEYHIS